MPGAGISFPFDGWVTANRCPGVTRWWCVGVYVSLHYHLSSFCRSLAPLVLSSHTSPLSPSPHVVCFFVMQFIQIDFSFFFLPLFECTARLCRSTGFHNGISRRWIKGYSVFIHSVISRLTIPLFFSRLKYLNCCRMDCHGGLKKDNNWIQGTKPTNYWWAPPPKG